MTGTALVHEEPAKITHRWFDRITLGSGLVVLVLLTLVGLFLLLRSRDALTESGVWDFLTREGWRTDVQPPRIGVLGLLTGTVIVAFIAIVIAVPFGVLAALFITEYSSLRSRRYLTALVDLLAAVPSLLYGIWGFLFLSAADRAAVAMDERAPRVHPDLQDRRRRPLDRVDLHRRHRRVADGPAHRGVGGPRGVRPDPAG